MTTSPLTIYSLLLNRAGIAVEALEVSTSLRNALCDFELLTRYVAPDVDVVLYSVQHDQIAWTLRNAFHQGKARWFFHPWRRLSAPAHPMPETPEERSPAGSQPGFETPVGEGLGSQHDVTVRAGA